MKLAAMLGKMLGKGYVTGKEAFMNISHVRTASWERKQGSRAGPA